MDEQEAAKLAGKQGAIEGLEEYNNLVQHGMQYAQAAEMQQYGAEFLRKNPDMANQFDLFATELQSIPHDPVEDPYHQKRFAKAAKTVRNGVRRADQKWHAEQEAKFGKGLALNPLTGQLVESVPGPDDVPIEESDQTGNSYVDQHRAKRANIRRTFANSGETS